MQAMLQAAAGLSPMQILYIFVLGFALSAAAGFRAFLPMAVLSGLLNFSTVIQLPQGSSYSWIGSDIAFAVFVVAAVLEIAADKVPALDHAQDSALVFIKPVAGFLLTAVPLTQVDPLLATVAGIVVGATVSEGLHLFKGGTRAASTVSSAGAGNPVLSFFEDVFAFLLSGLSALSWLLWMPLALLVIVVLAVLIYRAVSGRGGKQKSDQTSGPPEPAPE